MCLYALEEIEVESPIKVYKAVIHITDPLTGGEIWMTPFRHKVIPKEVIEGKKMFVADYPEYDPLENWMKNRYKSIDCKYKGFIGKGYIHAYGNILDAAYDFYSFYLPTYEGDKDRMPEIYECEIPINEVYRQYCWKGKFENTILESVAAREMRFVRLLRKEEYARRYTAII